ncbi:RIP metalloprotease RseP [Abyssibius alkaniclasticus]|uniref:RIP metalloprotease RseP n=1 Tax=Abyssibius alkaniclasticus TaxID=2881234 RepID=UPI004059B68C
MIDFAQNIIDVALTLGSFIVIISIVVFVHEMGHYLVGRWCGIHAEVFSLGFGKIILSRTDKRGMRWQLAAVPLGGYVRFLGDADAASATQDKAATLGPDAARSFPAASTWRRALTIAAGPAANMVLAVAIYTGVIMVQGVAVDEPRVGEVLAMPYETGLQVDDVFTSVEGTPVSSFAEVFDVVSDQELTGMINVTVLRDGRARELEIPPLVPAMVAFVHPESPAKEAGLEPGDVVLAVNGTPVNSFTAMKDLIVASGSTPITLNIWRNGADVTTTLTARPVEQLRADGTVTNDVVIGISMVGSYFDVASRTPGIFEALGIGATTVKNQISFTITAIRAIIRGALSPKNLSGPVGIAQATGDVARQGLPSLIQWTAALSAGIGFVNLLPIPILDGGHLVLLAVEAVRRRKPSERAQQIVMSIGLFFVLFMFIFVTYNDIMRLL